MEARRAETHAAHRAMPISGLGLRQPGPTVPGRSSSTIPQGAPNLDGACLAAPVGYREPDGRFGLRAADENISGGGQYLPPDDADHQTACAFLCLPFTGSQPKILCIAIGSAQI